MKTHLDGCHWNRVGAACDINHLRLLLVVAITILILIVTVAVDMWWTCKMTILSINSLILT